MIDKISLNRKIHRFLGRLLALTLLLIILHSPLITNWIYSEDNLTNEQVSLISLNTTQ